MKSDNYVWALMIALGVSMFMISQFLLLYPPIAILSIGIIMVGVTTYAVSLDNGMREIDIMIETLARNIESIFIYYGKERFYRIFMPSSMGHNGMLLLDEYPIDIKEVRKKLINIFDGKHLGIFLETPGSLVVEELRKTLSFKEDVSFILKKGVVELFGFARDVKIKEVKVDNIVVEIMDPKPLSKYKVVGYVPSLVVGSLIAEALSRPVFIDDQKLQGKILKLKISLI